MTEETRRLDVKLARLEVKLDQLLKRDSDHEARIRKLERAVWLWSGAAAAGGGVVGSLLVPLIGGG